MKIGFFGKLPGYGDFIQRNVNPGLVDFWDNWLSQCIDVAKQHLHDTWKQTYFTSPIWRFTLPSELAGTSLVSGVMMPSVDSAGRDYPFTVFCELPHQSNVYSVSAAIDSCHQQAEVMLLNLLVASRPQLDEIADGLAGIYTRLDCANKRDKVPQLNARFSSELFRFESAFPISPDEVHHEFIAHIQSQTGSKTSVWSYQATEQFDNHSRYYNGMPPVETFASLLIGK